MIQIRFSDREAAKLLALLVVVEILFVIAYLVIHAGATNARWGPLRLPFNLNAEVSIPTWFSSMQYFVVAAALWCAAQNNQHREHVSSLYLLIGSLLFLFMSVDESAALHEKMTSVVKHMKMQWLLVNGQHAAWLIVYGVLFVAIVGLGARQLLSLWKHYRKEMLFGIAGAVVLVSGAVGVEMVSYRFMGLDAAQQTTYKELVAAEEFLEMVGMSIVLYAVLRLTTRLTAPATPQQAL